MNIKGNIFSDIATAVKLTGEVRKARKSGASEVQIKQVYTVPCFTFGPAYSNTIEWSLGNRLGREADRAVMEVFNGLPYDTQRWLEHLPKKPGEWAERARFWQRELKPVLPPKLYYRAITAFIQRYIHCLRMRQEVAR